MCADMSGASDANQKTKDNFIFLSFSLLWSSSWEFNFLQCYPKVFFQSIWVHSTCMLVILQIDSLVSCLENTGFSSTKQMHVYLWLHPAILVTHQMEIILGRDTAGG